MSKSMNTKKLITMAMFIAISIVLVAFIHFPIFPAVSFLEYDPADISILIGTFAFGPLAGCVLTIVTSVIQGITVSAASGLYGIIMHIISTCTLVLVAGNIKKLRSGAGWTIVSLVIGCLAMAAVMGVANLIITPLFMGVPVDAVKALLFPAIIPFNLIKAGINSAVAFVIYKPLSHALGKMGAKPQPLKA